MGSAPVVDDNGVLLASVSAEALARTGFDVEVEDAMSLGVPTVIETASVGDAVSLMSRGGVDRMPIVTARAGVVGVIAAMDVIRWLRAPHAVSLRGSPPGGRKTRAARLARLLLARVCMTSMSDGSLDSVPAFSRGPFSRVGP